jgi:hypothetical protein
VEEDRKRESNGSNSKLIKFKSGFSTCDSRYQFELRSDGIGTIYYTEFSPESEEFFHEINLTELTVKIEKKVQEQINFQREIDGLEDSEIEKISQEIKGEKLEDFFWDEINQTLEDPFFRSFDEQDEWGVEFFCENGNSEEFEEFLELCVLTERDISAPDDYLIIDSETDCDASGLNDSGYWSERLGELVEIGCQYFKPAGHRYDYNDGWGDRLSSYSMYSESISIPLKEAYSAPTREKMLGMKRLRKKLAAMKTEDSVIQKLTAF